MSGDVNRRLRRYTSILAALVFAGAAAWYVPNLLHARKMEQCASNLQGLGLSFNRYANDHDYERFPVTQELDYFPGIAEILSNQTDGTGAFFPKYHQLGPHSYSPFLDASLPEGAGDEEYLRSMDESYWYLPFVLTDERAAAEFLDAFRNTSDEKKPEYFRGVDRSYLVTKSFVLFSHAELYSTRWGAYVFLYKKDFDEIRALYPDKSIDESDDYADSREVVALERPSIHGDGGHVMFVDGHIEFISYPGKFPMTKQFIEGLLELDRLRENRSGD